MNCVRELVHALPERDQVESDEEIQVGTPPDIERISPLEPRVRPIVFPTRVSHDMKVRTSSLLLKVFQSVRERAPVVVLLARLRLMEVPAA